MVNARRRKGVKFGPVFIGKYEATIMIRLVAIVAALILCIRLTYEAGGAEPMHSDCNCRSMSVRYVVGEGDTLSSIADEMLEMGTTGSHFTKGEYTEWLIEANGIENPDVIQIGCNLVALITK